MPQWIRGKEWAELITGNYNQAIPIMALGSSKGTGQEDIVADIIVVKSFDELEGLENSRVSLFSIHLTLIDVSVAIDDTTL